MDTLRSSPSASTTQSTSAFSQWLTFTSVWDAQATSGTPSAFRLTSTDAPFSVTSAGAET